MQLINQNTEGLGNWHEQIRNREKCHRKKTSQSVFPPQSNLCTKWWRPSFQAMKTGLSCSACLPRTRKPVNRGDLSTSNRWGNSARGSQHTRRDPFFESFHARASWRRAPGRRPAPGTDLGDAQQTGCRAEAQARTLTAARR